jgi:ATP-dependent DNA helicase RecQ
LFGEVDGSGIVYCATVKTVNALTDWLQSGGHNVRPYHGGMRAPERKENQDLFMRGELKAMVATNAFGMGVDKSDIRFVAHFQVPGSLEAYYQESGRAGRDGKSARCLLFYQLEDRRTQSFFMAGRYPNAESLMAIYQAIKTLQAQESGIKLVELQEAVSEVAKKKVQTGLHLLKQEGVVHESRYGRFRLQNNNLNREKIEALARQYDTKAERDQTKLEQMMLYGQIATCRWKFLHDYFNEPFNERCGHCDNCVHPLEQQLGMTADAAPETVPA